MLRSIQTKILLGFMLVIALMGLLGAWSILTLSNLGNANRDTFQHKLVIVQRLGRLDSSLTDLRAASTRLIFYRVDSQALGRFERSATNANSVLEAVTGKAISSKESPEFLNGLVEVRLKTTFLLGELRSQLGRDSLKTYSLPKMLAAEQSRNSRATAEIFTSELDPVFDEVKSRIITLEQSYVRDLNSVVGAGLDRAETIRVRVFIIGSVVVLLFVGFSIRFSKIIVTPIRELTERAKEITAGELNQLLVPRTRDELGVLATQFNEMAKKLGEYEELNLKKILEEKAISESIVQSMSDGLILIDRFGVILSINVKAQELFGLMDVEGQNCLEVALGVTAFESSCTAALHGTWTEKDRLAIVEHSVQSGIVYLQRDVTPITSSDNSGTVAFLLIYRDVTKAFELEKMRTEFVGMVSHELRTPLTAIRMSVDLLAESEMGKLDEIQTQFVEAIREESERLLRIVNDLMDLARYQAGNFEVRPRSFALDEFFETIALPLIASSTELGVELRIERDPNITEIVADPDRIKQVFVNLIANALRYTSKGGVIAFGVRKGDRSGAAEYFVRDTGAGIAPDFLPKVFQRFAIIGSDAKSGTGLGLAIVKEIVEAHGGTIHVRSEVGNGTEFWFTLADRIVA